MSSDSNQTQNVSSIIQPQPSSPFSGSRVPSFEVIDEGEQLPTVLVAKEDLFVRPSVSYFHDRLEMQDNDSNDRKSSVMDKFLQACPFCADPCAVKRKEERKQRKRIEVDQEDSLPKQTRNRQTTSNKEASLHL